jgi:Ca2+-binding RTX toxin-like protein
MSFVISDTISTVFSAPTAVPFAPAGTSTTATPISTSTTAGTQLGGGTTYTLAPISTGTGNLVLSGTATVVNLSSGAVNASLIGGGSILEATVISGAGSNKLVEMSTDVAYDRNAIVNSAAPLASGGTVSSAAGGLTPAASGTTTGQANPGFAFYAHTGAGNDQIEGSSANDFIRGGAGNDTINGFGGNDVIRGGSGSDSIFGGVGNDTLYYTSDQLDGSTDIFSDFATGIDKIAVQSTAVASTGNISGLGTNTITFTASGTKVVSVGTVINIADIQIV